MAPRRPAGGLKKLELLDLSGTQINDAGCATLVAALDSGALPALKELDLGDIPASDAAKAAVHEAHVLLSAPTCLRLTPGGAESDLDDGSEPSDDEVELAGALEELPYSFADLPLRDFERKPEASDGSDLDGAEPTDDEDEGS